jgi:hypothetical protein
MSRAPSVSALARVRTLSLRTHLPRFAGEDNKSAVLLILPRTYGGGAERSEAEGDCANFSVSRGGPAAPSSPLTENKP